MNGDYCVFGPSGKCHHPSSSKLIDRRKVEREDVICDCGKVMYQDLRDETVTWIFLEYSCTCGVRREFNIDKREEV